MFTAVLKNGTTINLLEQKNKMDLKALREEQRFYCPECKGPVTLKIGEKKITHFAHEANYSCIKNAEAESMYHLEGKLQLFQMLQQLGLHPVLEPYFPTIKQRGDISVVWKEKHFIIEFQCSPIPHSLMKKRTFNYQKLNFVPIWVLGYKNIKSYKQKKMRLSSFIFDFIVKYNKTYVIPTYCPLNKKLLLFSSIISISSAHSYVHSQSIPLSSLSLSDIPIRHFELPIQDWKNKISRQKRFDIHHKTMENNRFLKELYINRLHPHFLPPFIGIPLKENIVLATSPLLWQSYIFIDHFNTKRPVICSIYQIYEQFEKRIERKEIKIRELLMIPGLKWEHVVDSYIKSLVALNILAERKDHFYAITSVYQQPHNYERMHQIEEEFYTKWARTYLH